MWERPEAPPPKERSPWPWILLGCGIAIIFVLLLGIGCAALFTATTEPEPPGADPPTPTPQQELPDDENTVTLGEAGQVGEWEVTVTGIETTTTYGDEITEETAQGEFKIVNLTVRNTASEARTFDSTAVTLEDTGGNTHSSQVTLAEEELLLQQVNPGNEASGQVVFDVPQNTEVTAVVVEDVWSMEEPLRVTVR